MDKVYDKRKKEIHGKKFLFVNSVVINMILITSCCKQHTEIN